MTNPDYTHISLVVDRSGSMVTIAHDMEGGLKTFLEEQAALPGLCRVDLSIFDTLYEEIYTGRPASDATVQITPRGGTALLDAIGKTVVSLGERLAKMSEDDRPDTVIVAIITDGEENSSREWKLDQIKKLVETQIAQWDWKFIFLGANIDAFSTGMGMGMAKGMSSGYDASSVGVRRMSESTSNYVTKVRGGDKDAKLTDEESA